VDSERPDWSPLLSAVREIQRRPKPPRQLQRVVVRPKVQVEQARLVAERVVVQRGDLDAIRAERARHGVHLAAALHDALSASATPLTSAPAASPAAGGPSFDPKQIEAIMGRSGTLLNPRVFQVGVPRAETITEGGEELPPAMGVGMPFNFQDLGDGKAAITGDFVLIASEVNPVARALRANGIEVTALHNHALGDEPRLFYMHFWAHDDALKLARGLRAALDLTNSRK